MNYPAVAQDHPTAVATPSHSSEWRGKGRVLVVDDEDAVRIVITSAVTRLGFTVDSASDGPTAIALFELDPASYAVVLLDVRLPNMDGVEVMRRMRRVRADAPVILMSGYNKLGALDEQGGEIPAAFLHKPFTLGTLTTAVRAVLKV
jgi:two-component system, cell cycle sensor histidine kinase and response regulator CckA